MMCLILLFTTKATAQPDIAYFSYSSDGWEVTITGYSGPGGAVTIPASIENQPVTAIGYETFWGASNVTSVTIPSSVTSIGQEAFYFCIALTNATIPDSVTSIGQQSFCGCTNLASVTIQRGVMTIGPGAFEDCASLTGIAIPSSVTSIGEDAFADCSSLTSISIPSSVTNIGVWAFGDCSSLTNATIPSGITTVPYGLFVYCYSLSNIYFLGNAPTFGTDYLVPDFPPAFWCATNVSVFFLPNTSGWSNTYDGVSAFLWNPIIQTSNGDFGVQGNQFGFDITGTTNIPVVVEASTNLANRVWTALTNVSLTDGLFHFSEPAQANSAGRFYRIRSP
jgi:hypothetical protein